MSVDLDAVIAAETTGEPIDVTVGGETYRLLPEMPWDTANLIGQSKVREAFAGLVVDGSADGFADAMLADRPTWKQITSRLNAIYATGESSAS